MDYALESGKETIEARVNVMAVAPRRQLEELRRGLNLAWTWSRVA